MTGTWHGVADKHQCFITASEQQLIDEEINQEVETHSTTKSQWGLLLGMGGCGKSSSTLALLSRISKMCVQSGIDNMDASKLYDLHQQCIQMNEGNKWVNEPIAEQPRMKRTKQFMIEQMNK